MSFIVKNCYSRTTVEAIVPEQSYNETNKCNNGNKKESRIRPWHNKNDSLY